MRAMKDSGIEWIGEIPQEWRLIRIKYLGEYRNGLTYSPLDITDEKSGTLVLRSSNIKDGKLSLNDNVYVSTRVPTALKIKKEDILNSKVFSYYLGTFLTSTINQLTGSNFGNMKVVYVEDKKEQDKIVRYLDAKCSEIDALIVDKKKQLELLADYKKALIYEYVTGKKEVDA